MLRQFKTLGGCFSRAVYVGIIKHDAIEHAGYLAFLALLSLFPFLVLLFWVAGFLGQGSTGVTLIKDLLNNLPPGAVAAIRPRIEEISSGPPQGLITVSILGAIWTASSAVEGLRTVLNNAYHVSTPPAYWFRRLMSILQLFFIMSVLLLGMFLLVFAPIVIHKLEVLFEITVIHEEGTNLKDIIFSFSAISLFLVVAYLYFVLPNIRQTFFSVVPGAFMTATLWIFAAALFSFYLSKFDQVNLIYGSLGGIIATLLFFYINNVIFIIGAEFNYQLSIAYGNAPEPIESSGKPFKENDFT